MEKDARIVESRTDLKINEKRKQNPSPPLTGTASFNQSIEGQEKSKRPEEGRTGSPPAYRRWLILAVALVGSWIGGYLFVQSYKPDDVAKSANSEKVVVDGKALPADQPELSAADDPDPGYSGGRPSPLQIVIMLTIPVFFTGIAPSAATFGHIYTGRYSDGSRAFWMVTVWLLLTLGVIAYWVFGNRKRTPRK